MLQLTYNPIERQIAQFIPPQMCPEDYEEEFEDFMHDMEDLGLTFLGCGYFSSVWRLPDPLGKTVIKISHLVDDMCRHYMLWIQNNQHEAGPAIQSYQEIDDTVYVRMPEYYPLPHELYADYRAVSEVLLEGMWPSQDCAAQQLAYKVRDRFGNYRLDLHSANIMVDSDNNLILTDPISFESKDDPWEN